MTTTMTCGGRSRTCHTCPATGGGQRGERGTSTMALMMNMLTGVPGVRVRRRLRRDGDNDDNVEEGGSHPTTPQTTVTPELVEWLRSAGRDWQWAEEKRATLTTAATTNTSTGVSGVRIGWLPGMGDGGDRGATVTIMTTSRRADCIPPR